MMGDGERMNRKNKGISPVVATVIIVAIAIALAMAVALWASGLVGIFTRFEEVKIVSAYAESGKSLGGTSYQFIVNMTLRNTGSADATIDNVIINGKPYTALTGVDIYIGGTKKDPATSGEPLAAGETKTLGIGIATAAGFKSGQTLDIKIHTSAGHEYAKAVVLP